MPFLDRERARVHYDVSSGTTGTWVTLINGHARSGSDFRAFGRYLVERGFSVLTLDNRGSGKTTSEPFTVLDMLGDVEELWQQLGVVKTHLLGISYGGVLCQKLAVANPGIVQSLVLVSTTPKSSFLQPSRRLAELSHEERQVELGRYFGPRFSSHNPVLFRSLVKQMSDGFSNAGFLHNAKLQRAALDRFDLSAELAGLRCPCLVLHGQADQVIPPLAAQELSRAIPGSQLEVWPEIGHLFLAEAPRAFYERCGDFFSAQS